MKELHLAEGTVRHEKRVGVGTLFWKVGCMTIEKVINNNIVSAFDETGREVVVMGRGIGFGNRPGAKIPESCLPESRWSMQRSRVILFLMQKVH